MSALDHFVDELRAANGDVAARSLAAIFHKLQAGDDPEVIDLHDQIVEIVGRRIPLQERLAAVLGIEQ